MALGDILGGFAKGFGQGISDVATISLEEEIRKKGEQRKLEMTEMAQRKKKNESLAFYEDMFGAKQGKTDLERVTNIMTAARDKGVNIGFGPDNTLTANRMTPQEWALYRLEKEGKLSDVNLQAIAGGLPTEGQALGLALRQDTEQGDSGTAFAGEEQIKPDKSSGPGVVQSIENFLGGGSPIIGKTTDRTPVVWLSQIIPILKEGEGIEALWEDFHEEFPSIDSAQFLLLLKDQRLPNGEPLIRLPASFGTGIPRKTATLKGAFEETVKDTARGIVQSGKELGGAAKKYGGIVRERFF